ATALALALLAAVLVTPGLGLAAANDDSAATVSNQACNWGTTAYYYGAYYPCSNSLYGYYPYGSYSYSGYYPYVGYNTYYPSTYYNYNTYYPYNYFSAYYSRYYYPSYYYWWR